MSLFEELKRRNVFRAGIAYLLLGWVVLQAADFALDLIDAPNWIIQALFIIGLVGLQFVLFFAWAFELTEQGIRCEKETECSTSVAPAAAGKLDRAIIVLLSLALVLLLADRFPGRDAAAPETVTPAAGDERSVAVLPFVNMSPDADNEYFSDGVAEEILNVLADVPDLEVAARTSAFAFKGTSLGIGEIARQLGVEYVLDLAAAHMIAGALAERNLQPMQAFRNRERTIALDASDPRPHHWPGILLANCGYLDRVRKELQIAVLEGKLEMAEQLIGSLEGLSAAEARRLSLLVEVVRDPQAVPEFLDFVDSHEVDPWHLVLEMMFLGQYERALAVELRSYGYPRVSRDALGPPPACRKLPDGYDCTPDGRGSEDGADAST